MTKEEKAQVYSLLSVTEHWITGYVNQNQDIPVFSDDGEINSSIELSSVKNDIQDIYQDGYHSIEEIAECIRTCTKCKLCETRTNAVPGLGSEHPLVMLIGEGPGFDEDRTGEPFVGKAGQLLDKMLAAIQLSRTSNCFIANIVKCRPPNNRDPEPIESSACAPFIESQIQLLKPSMILTVGRIAVQNLLKISDGITRIHGKFFDYKGIPLLPTYHPSALLRNETLKRPAWEDLKIFKTKLLELNPDYDKDYK